MKPHTRHVIVAIIIGLILLIVASVAEARLCAGAVSTPFLMPSPPVIIAP